MRKLMVAALAVSLAFSAGCLDALPGVKRPSARDYPVDAGSPDYQRGCQSEYAEYVDRNCAGLKDRKDCMLEAKDRMIECLTEAVEEKIKAMPPPRCWPEEENETR